MQGERYESTEAAQNRTPEPRRQLLPTKVPAPGTVTITFSLLTITLLAGLSGFCCVQVLYYLCSSRNGSHSLPQCRQVLSSSASFPSELSTSVLIWAASGVKSVARGTLEEPLRQNTHQFGFSKPQEIPAWNVCRFKDVKDTLFLAAERLNLPSPGSAPSRQVGPTLPDLLPTPGSVFSPKFLYWDPSRLECTSPRL